MNKIEIIGRLKENVKINGKRFVCEDVNLDSNFIIDLSIELVRRLGHTPNDKKFHYEKFFDDEKVSRVEFEVELNGEKYELVVTRDTFCDKILIGCEIEASDTNIDLFGSTYELKVKIIELFNRLCVNTNIFLLQDFNNELICQSAYIEIHKLENRFRNLLTKYLMKKYGVLLLSKTLKKDVDEYSKWFRKETTGKYMTFKRINTDYCNLDFAKLPKVLDLKDSQCVDENNFSASTEIAQLQVLLNDEANIGDILKQLTKVQEQINKRKNIFDDQASEEEKAAAIRDWGTDQVVQRADLKTFLDSNFKELWEGKLSKMRNMVAHNKPICKELYDDIIQTCQSVNEIFDKCFEFIERFFYPDEEGVLSALEDMAYEEEQRNAFDVEAAREEVGIMFTLSESVIETMVTESSKSVQNFMNVIGNLSNMRNVFDEISAFNEEYSIIDEDEIDEEFKRKVFNIINEELELNDDFERVKNLILMDMIYDMLYDDIDIERAIELYTDDKKYPCMNFKFECFEMDYDISWYGLDNKEYEVQFYGEIAPENDWVDEFEFKLLIDKEQIKTYCIKVDYGDYVNQSEGYFDDSQVEYLVADIEDSITNAVEKFEKIRDVSDKLMELI